MKRKKRRRRRRRRVLESCLVGVARDSVKRKGDLPCGRRTSVGAALSAVGIWANTSPEAELFPALRLPESGHRPGLRRGHRILTNAESQELIYTFTATFTRRQPSCGLRGQEHASC